ncbi:hypothetical protein J3458_003653 [Metarhizium acridum]|uniref:uncharacterized protein n=1 Tax=Metarhizium acridum TaxID=92637 RepID=UPI001C6D0835|nr:hypothetical protein J3458_003653 [Metarhizium acridum]
MYIYYNRPVSIPDLTPSLPHPINMAQIEGLNKPRAKTIRRISLHESPVQNKESSKNRSGMTLSTGQTTLLGYQTTRPWHNNLDPPRGHLLWLVLGNQETV